MMSLNPRIHSALVSTNSVTQGEQVSPLWGTLRQRFAVEINFAYRTFIWDNESADRAHVHCVIIGFSACGESVSPKRLYFADGHHDVVDSISPYLLAGSFVCIDSRSFPLSDVPICSLGNTAKDRGYLTLSESERDDFVSRYPDKAALHN